MDINYFTPQKGVDYFTEEDVASLNIPLVDQAFNPISENAQSGKAVAEALGTLKKKFELIDSLIVGYSLLTAKPDDWEYAFGNYYQNTGTASNTQLEKISFEKGVGRLCYHNYTTFFSKITNIEEEDPSNVLYKMTIIDGTEISYHDTSGSTLQVGDNVYFERLTETDQPTVYKILNSAPEWESNKYYSKTDEISQINRYYDTKYSSVRLKVQLPDSVTTTRMIINIIGGRDNNESGTAGYIVSEQGYRYLDYAVNIANGVTDNGILYEHYNTPNSSPSVILSGADSSLVKDAYDLITDWIGIYFMQISMYDGSTIPTGTKIYLYGVKANED